VQLAAGENVLPDRSDQRIEQIAGGTHPAGQRGAGYLNTLTGVYLGLPVERKMIAELRHNYVCQQARSGETALNGTRGRRRLNHAITTRTGELRPHMPNHSEVLGDVLQLFGDIFPELAQLGAAVRAAVADGRVGSHFAREVLGERLAIRPALRRLLRCNALDSRFRRGLGGLHVFEFKLKLLELDDDLLALAAEDHAAQLLHHQLQVLDPLAAGAQFISLLG
jgi:hypothetical protein